jgi:hypothetical protein
MLINRTSIIKLSTNFENLSDCFNFNVTLNNHIVPASEYTWYSIQIISNILTYSIGTIGNLLVIFVILMNRKVKTVTNMYLLHLAITDVIYLQSIPFSVITLIKQQWIFNFVFCKIFWTFTGINQFTSIFIIVVLAFDR